MKKFKLTAPLITGYLLSNLVFSFPLLASTDKKDDVWISIGTDAVKLIQDKHQAQFNFSQVFNIESQQNDVVIANFSKSKINALGKIMHQDFKRCPGFILHQSQAEAESYVAMSNQKQSQNKSLNQSQTAIEYTIDNPELVNSLISQLTTANMQATVTSLGDFNTRYYQTNSGVESVNWLKGHWQNIIATRADMHVELFEHANWLQPSVIATIEGTTNADEVIVIGAHLDSVNWTTDPLFGRAPGSDDNASGIAVLTEALTVLAASDFKPLRTIKLIGYAAEEVGLLGAKEIAKNYKTNGVNVVGVAQFDMTGFRGTSNKDIVFITDYTNALQNQFMADLIDNYLPNVTYGHDVCGYGCSDHAAWHNEGFIASFPFESQFADDNKKIHTAQDDTFDAEHALNFAKLSIAYLIELSSDNKTETTPTPPTPPSSSGGGGVISFGSILFLLLLSRRKVVRS